MKNIKVLTLSILLVSLISSLIGCGANSNKDVSKENETSITNEMNNESKSNNNEEISTKTNEINNNDNLLVSDNNTTINDTNNNTNDNNTINDTNTNEVINDNNDNTTTTNEETNDIEEDNNTINNEEENNDITNEEEDTSSTPTPSPEPTPEPSPEPEPQVEETEAPTRPNYNDYGWTTEPTDIDYNPNVSGPIIHPETTAEVPPLPSEGRYWRYVVFDEHENKEFYYSKSMLVTNVDNGHVGCNYQIKGYVWYVNEPETIHYY